MNRDLKLDLREVTEGQRVTMRISSHDYSKYGSVLTGVVKQMPRDKDIEMIYDEDRGRPMVDLVVEGDNGTVWNWNVDNGYVIGPVDEPDRPNRSDIGKFRGLYNPEAREKFDKSYDAGINETPMHPPEKQKEASL